MPQNPLRVPGPFQARKVTHLCAASRIVLQDFSFFPIHSRLFKFPAEYLCFSRSITLGAPSGRTGERFPKILIPLGWDTRWANGRETHSLSTQLVSTTRCGWMALVIRAANRCT